MVLNEMNHEVLYNNREGNDLQNELTVHLMNEAAADIVNGGRDHIVKNAIAAVLKAHPKSNAEAMHKLLRQLSGQYEIEVTVTHRRPKSSS